jgi:aspartate aminotransferase
VSRTASGARLTDLADRVGSSGTMDAAGAASRHPHPISLAIGEPEGLPPPEAVEAAVRALREGRVRYGPAAGLAELREAIARDRTRRSGLPHTLDDVIVTAGGKQGLHDALRCLAGPGDEVLVPAPYWPSFLQQVASAGASAVVTPAGTEGLVDVDALEAAITPRTRVLVLNDPSNPSSRTWGAERLRRVAAIAERHDLWVLADEVYADLVLDGEHESLLSVAPGVRERLVVVQSFSKRFAMCGLRLGSVSAPRPLIEALTRLVSASLTCASTMAQHAGIAALEHGAPWLGARRAEYRDRRERARRVLESLPGLTCPPTEAAFYLFPRLPSGVDDRAWCARLREEQGVLVTPGTVFGAPGHVRISYSGSTGDLEEGLRRIADAGAGLSR